MNNIETESYSDPRGLFIHFDFQFHLEDYVKCNKSIKLNLKPVCMEFSAGVPGSTGQGRACHHRTGHPTAGWS